jgi:hypothetical protein
MPPMDDGQSSVRGEEDDLTFADSRRDHVPSFQFWLPRLSSSNSVVTVVQSTESLRYNHPTLS